MKIAYLDCFSGIAGDMLLGALIDAGVPADALRAEIAKLNLDGVEVKADKCVRKGITGTDVQVITGHDHAHRHLSTIEKIIDGSALAAGVKERSKRIFRNLGEAEAAIHGVSIEKVHFHEVGAIDAIVDIVGACVGLDLLGVEKLYCSPLNLGSGTVKAAHGVMPVPAPATAALVKGLPTYSDGPAVELTTPTGAAIVSTLATGFGPMPAMRIEAAGYGAGDKDFPDRANMLRLVVGEASSATESTEIFVIEANVDDMSPEWAGYVRGQLLDQGALDVALTPVFMKKDRPGYQIQVLAKPEDRDRLGDLMLAETTTLGIRYYPAQRRVLERAWKTVSTLYGDVRIKVASDAGVIRNFAPEFEDCKKLAEAKKVPLKMVWQQANFEYLRLTEEERLQR
ncbi:MAG: nickel pincer cofactor biosynthesis protein LarC [Bryobacterales bacterium]|nr:nickel pincer cofactor biosynthesis protein LarC [Bryobacterales bacterium]